MVMLLILRLLLYRSHSGRRGLFRQATTMMTMLISYYSKMTKSEGGPAKGSDNGWLWMLRKNQTDGGRRSRCCGVRTITGCPLV
jgi:hypothetical protein